LFKFLHAADLHLDTQPSGLHGYPEEVATVLRDASLDAFDNLVRETMRQGVAFCVFAGDIYDGADRGTRAELAFRRGLTQLADAGIRTFIAHGNHDPTEAGWSTVSTWPDLVTVFRPSEPETFTFEVHGTTVAVHGVSYAERGTTDNLATRFERHDGADVQIGVLHTNAGSNPDHDPYAPCSLDDLRAIGLDYWALGHIHKRQNLAGPSPWIVYPGNTQGRHAKPSEQGAKGAVVVTVTDGGAIETPEFVALDVLRFLAPTMSVEGLADAGALTDAMSQLADELRAEHPRRALVIRPILEGRGTLHELLAGPDSRSDFLESLRHEWAGRSPLVWWDRIVDHTGGEVDLAELEAQNDFLGNALRAVDPTAEIVTPLARLTPRTERLGVTLPDPGDAELVERARMLVADLLTDGER
jgi:DNA repair exonuclease SbcCD nuclease subunit